MSGCLEPTYLNSLYFVARDYCTRYRENTRIRTHIRTQTRTNTRTRKRTRTRTILGVDTAISCVGGSSGTTHIKRSLESICEHPRLVNLSPPTLSQSGRTLTPIAGDTRDIDTRDNFETETWTIYWNETQTWTIY